MTEFETKLLKELHNISEILDEISESLDVLGHDRFGTLDGQAHSGLSTLKQITDIMGEKE